MPKCYTKKRSYDTKSSHLHAVVANLARHDLRAGRDTLERRHAPCGHLAALVAHACGHDARHVRAVRPAVRHNGQRFTFIEDVDRVVACIQRGEGCELPLRSAHRSN